MTTGTPPADRKAAFKDTAKVALWGLGLFAAVQGVGAYLSHNHSGATVAQLLLAEFGAGRLGVAWSDPLAALPTIKQIALRAARGAAYGAAVAVVLLGLVQMTHRADIGAGSPAVAPLVMGLLMVAFGAARDELLLRGLVLRAAGPAVSPWVKLALCGVAGAAFRFGVDPAAGPWGWAFSGVLGVALGALWLVDRGAWLAVGANTAYGFVLGPMSEGGVLDVRARGSAPLDASALALAVAAAAAVSGVVMVRRQMRQARGPEAAT